ncbi:hypothetical protein GCM10009861_01550 [Neomicrococcus aestuarii]
MHRLSPIADLTHTLKTVGNVNDGAESLPHERLVVGDENSDGGVFCGSIKHGVIVDTPFAANFRRMANCVDIKTWDN